ncbi:LptE family protein [candidate division KSB1 bacterium]|nr:LptE family protein [candidate division KSB1 bacterium]
MISGCGIYSFSGSLAPHLKTVAIPLFENKTVEFGLAEELTDMLVDEFTRDNSLKITEKSAADISVDGSIVRIDDRAGAFNENEQVQDIKIYITVAVKVNDQVKRTLLWEERITQWGGYDPASGPDARVDGITEALEKISQEILNKTVSGW